MPNAPVTPNALLRKSSTSRSGMLTGFSTRRKRAGRCVARVRRGSAIATMPAGAVSTPATSYTLRMSRMPTLSDSSSASKSTPAVRSSSTGGSTTGCNATMSENTTPSVGLATGNCVRDEGSYIQTPYSGGSDDRAARREPLGGARNDPCAFEQSALRPAHQQSTRAIAQRKCRLIAATGRRPFDGRYHIDGRGLLRRAGQHTAIGFGRLRVLHVVRDLDVQQLAALLGGDERLRTHQQVPIAQWPRIEELHRGVVRTGLVTVGAVEEFEPAAVRPHRIDAHFVVSRGGVPPREHDSAVVEHRRVQVVALVERDLLDVGAVGAHHMQHERGLVAILVLGIELRLALVEQDGLGLPLARRTEDDASVGKVVRCDVVALPGDRIRRDHAAELTRCDDVLPDVPGRLVFRVRAGNQWLVQGEYQPFAVVRRLHVAHVALALGDLER